MEFIFYILILIPLFFIAFFTGFATNKPKEKRNQKNNYYFNEEKDNNNYADFLYYDGSNKKGDN